MLDFKSTSLLILAAGKGSRMGGFPKGFLQINREFLIDQNLAVARELGLTDIKVVTSPTYYSKYQEHLDGRADVILNPSPERGMFSSIQCGLTHLRDGNVLLKPVDCRLPQVSSPFWGQWPLPKNYKAVIPRYAGRGGHPVWLSQSFVADLIKVSPYSRLDDEMRSVSTLSFVASAVEVAENINFSSEVRLS